MYAVTERRLGFEIHKTARQIKRYIDNDASKSYVEKMTGTHGRAVGYFYHNRHRDIFQKDFEQEFDIRRSSASTMLSLMEKNGLIERQGVPYDARLKKIVLTEKAIQVQQFVESTFERFESTMKQGITDEELQIFFSVLDKICSNLERNDSDD